MNDYWTFVKLTWTLLIAVFRIVAPTVVGFLLLHIMWTGGDVKNIHVAVIVLAAIWSTENSDPTRCECGRKSVTKLNGKVPICGQCLWDKSMKGKDRRGKL